MSNIYSDLEEGEIIDDVPPSPLPSPKIKKLPRRYELKENKGKHKKNCKHFTHYKFKQLPKSKEMLIKKHSIHNSSKFSSRARSVNKSNVNSKLDKVVLSKAFNYQKRSSPILTNRVNPSLENIKLKSILDLNKIKSIKLNPKPNLVKDIESCSFSEISAMYKAIQAENVKSLAGDLEKAKLVEKKISTTDADKQEANKGLNYDIVPSNSEAKQEESEDEEELRRIALSTCVAVACEPPIKQPVYSHPHVESVNDLAPSSNGNASSVSQSADNYEVVDMDLDEEDDKKLPVSDELFIIDKKPSKDVQLNSDSAVEKQGFASDDDFEVDILRAELIEKMYRQNLFSDKAKNIDDNASSKDFKDASAKNVNKCLPKENNKPSLSRTHGKVNKPQKRLIISLNSESSSEESDDANSSTKVIQENPVAKIEALISDIRQKSDCDNKLDDKVKDIPKAVSCLSKAQQEEYNTLLKILAQKKQDLSISTEGLKSTAAYSPVNDLKLLEEKLIGVSELLKNRRERLSSLLKDVSVHKQVYVKSKLTAQLLKEQYVAAEKVRRLKLQALSECCKKYENAKRTVFELESKTDRLKILCSRVGSCINGYNYSLPAGSTELTS